MQTNETGARKGAEFAAADAPQRAVEFASLPAKVRALIFAECPWLPRGLGLTIGLHSRETPASDVPLPSDVPAVEWHDFESPPGVPSVSIMSYSDDGNVGLYVGPRRPAAEVA